MERGQAKIWKGDRQRYWVERGQAKKGACPGCGQASFSLLYNPYRRHYNLLMKIIFLDIDGVVNPWRSEKDSSGRFGRKALENFKLIMDTVSDTFVVITSSWRYHHTLPEMKEFFIQAGISPGRILDITPDLRRTEGMIKHYPERNEEIQAWLDQHPGVEKFAIIDDVDIDQMENLENHFFQTNFEEGLTLDQSLKIINHLCFEGRSV